MKLDRQELDLILLKHLQDPSFLLAGTENIRKIEKMICDMLYNPRDKAVVAMLFEGIRGRANIEDSFEELLNLKKQHVHEDDCIIEAHRNDGTIRMVEVDPQTIKYVIEAIDATEYANANGTGDKATPLVDSDYVLKGIRSRKYNTSVPKRAMITNVFRIVKKYTDMPFINAVKTFQSGMLVTCVKMEKEKGRPLEAADYVNIVTMKFGQLDSVAYSLKQMHMKFKELIKEE